MDVIKALIIFIDFHHKCFDVFIGLLEHCVVKYYRWITCKSTLLQWQ